MADSPDQGQLNTQKRTHVTNEVKKAYPANRTNRGSMKKTYPTLLGMLAWRASGYA